MSKVYRPDPDPDLLGTWEEPAFTDASEPTPVKLTLVDITSHVRRVQLDLGRVASAPEVTPYQRALVIGAHEVLNSVQRLLQMALGATR